MRYLVCFFLALSSLSASEFRLAHVFQDQMILQRDMSVPIWGWAAAGTSVTVSFADQSLTCTANDKGYWRANLKPLAVSSEGQSLQVSAGDQRIERKNILVGEVWLCAGQSNMARTLGGEAAQYKPLKARIGEKNFPLVRFIRYGCYASEAPLQDMNPGVHGKAQWQAMDDKTAMDSMAMPFFMGRKLFKELNVPFGFIQVAVSGTTQTAWTEKNILNQVASQAEKRGLSYDILFKRSQDKLAKDKKHTFKTWDEYKAVDAAWQQKPNGRWPGAGQIIQNYPCVLFNGQIHPLAPFAFRGLMWHQGEGGPGEQHAERMLANITHWRQLFEHDFHYMYGALARNTSSPPPLDPACTLFYRSGRNIQFLKAQKLFGYDSNAAFVDFFDCGNIDTHWGEKDKSGERFAVAALSKFYGKPQPFTGPQMIDHKITDGEIRVTFTHVGDGLQYTPSIDGISGFVLVNGKDQSWIEPQIEGENILVFKDASIKASSNIFYAYWGNPHETLFNSVGHPASLFQVQPGNYPRMKNSRPLVKFIKKGDKGTKLNVSHVRRHAVVCRAYFNPYRKPADASNTLRFYLPKEWPKIVVQFENADVPVTVSDDNGRRCIDVELKSNAGPILFFNADKKEEALESADLSRF